MGNNMDCQQFCVRRRHSIDISGSQGGQNAPQVQTNVEMSANQTISYMDPRPWMQSFQNLSSSQMNQLKIQRKASGIRDVAQFNFAYSPKQIQESPKRKSTMNRRKQLRIDEDSNVKGFHFVNHSKRHEYRTRRRPRRFGSCVSTSSLTIVEKQQHESAMAELDQAIDLDEGVQQFNLQQSQVDIFENSHKFDSLQELQEVYIDQLNLRKNSKVRQMMNLEEESDDKMLFDLDMDNENKNECEKGRKSGNKLGYRSMSKLFSGSGTNMNSSQGGALLSSKISSRMSNQTKSKLLQFQKLDRKAQYTQFYDDIAINRDKVEQEERWIAGQVEQMFGGGDSQINKDGLELKRMSQVCFYVHGKSLVKVGECLLHLFLFCHMRSELAKDDFEHLKASQTVVRVKRDLSSSNLFKVKDMNNRIKPSIARQTFFHPENVEQIINFLNKNSKLFKQSAAEKQNAMDSSQSNVSRTLFRSSPGKTNHQANGLGQHLKNLVHIYDTLNAHVFQVLNSQVANYLESPCGTINNQLNNCQLIVKVPKKQTKRGILDLVFETQLQQMLRKKCGFENQFTIKEEIFQIEQKDKGEEQERILNYIVIEERFDCSPLGPQMTLKDFLELYRLGKTDQLSDFNKFHYISSPADANITGGEQVSSKERAQQLLLCKDEKVLYLLLQAVNIIEKLTVEFGIINYNISPLNLTITNTWTLIVTDFSVVDFIKGQNASAKASSVDAEEQELDANAVFKGPDVDDELNAAQSPQSPILMRSQLKQHIKLHKRHQSTMMANALMLPNQNAREQGPSFANLEMFSQKSRVFQIKTTQDYFQQSSSSIADFQLFSLKKVFECFEEFFVPVRSSYFTNNQGSQTQTLSMSINEQNKSCTNQAGLTIMDFLTQQYRSIDSTRLIDIMKNNLEQFICQTMQERQREKLIKLSALETCFSQDARLKLAAFIMDIAVKQYNQKLEAISLLIQGEIKKDIDLLLKAEKIYEESQQEVFTNTQYAKLCLNLSREYRRTLCDNQLAMQYLEQAFSLNQDLQAKIDKFESGPPQEIFLKNSSKKQFMATIGKSELELMLEYFKEMALLLHNPTKTGGPTGPTGENQNPSTTCNNIERAIDMQQKAYGISRVVHGDEHFQTFDCMINLAQLFDENGQKDKANETFKNCLYQFDRKECTRMIRGQEINDDVHDLNFNSSSSHDLSNNSKQKVKNDHNLFMQRSQSYAAMANNFQQQDIDILQKLGLYCRQKQEYERACDLLERVLQIKKSIVRQEYYSKQDRFGQKPIQTKDGVNSSDSSNGTSIDDIDNIYLTKDFATLYTDLALTYQGIDELDFALDYLSKSIQSLEREPESHKSLELAEQYISLADMLRKRGDLQHAIRSMLRAIDIEQQLSDRQLFLRESYRQLSEDYMHVGNFSEAVLCLEQVIQIQSQQNNAQLESLESESELLETYLSIAEASFKLKDYRNSNEYLGKIFEHKTDCDGQTEEMKQKAYKLMARNHQSMNKFQDAIQLLIKAIKLSESIEEKIGLYQQVTNCFISLEQYQSALENQKMVCKLLDKYTKEQMQIKSAGPYEAHRYKSCNMIYEPEEDGQKIKKTIANDRASEQQIDAMNNLIQIQFTIVKEQVQRANEKNDVTCIDSSNLLDSRENIQTQIDRYEQMKLTGREEFKQLKEMLGNIDVIIS